MSAEVELSLGQPIQQVQKFVETLARLEVSVLKVQDQLSKGWAEGSRGLSVLENMSVRVINKMRKEAEKPIEFGIRMEMDSKFRKQQQQILKDAEALQSRLNGMKTEFSVAIKPLMTGANLDTQALMQARMAKLAQSQPVDIYQISKGLADVQNNKMPQQKDFKGADMTAVRAALADLNKLQEQSFKEAFHKGEQMVFDLTNKTRQQIKEEKALRLEAIAVAHRKGEEAYEAEKAKIKEIADLKKQGEAANKNETARQAAYEKYLADLRKEKQLQEEIQSTLKRTAALQSVRKQAFGGEATKMASPNELNRVAAAYNKVETEAHKAQMSTRDFGMAVHFAAEKSQAEINQLNNDGFGRTVRALAAARHEVAKFGDDSRKAMLEAKAGSDKANTSYNSGNKELNFQVLNFNTLLRLTAIQTLHTAYGRVVSKIHDANTEYVELSRRITEVQNLMHNSPEAFHAILNEVTNIAKASGVAQKDVTEGLYQTVSAQLFGTSKEAFDFVAKAAMTARIEMVKTNEVIEPAAALLTNFKNEGMSAELIMAKLSTAVELGTLRMDELNGVLGKIGQQSNSLGVSSNELLAIISAFTHYGVKASEAGTMLGSLMTRLIKPNKELAEELKNLGFESADAAIKSMGFVNFLRSLEQAASASSSKVTAITEMMGTIRASRAGLALLNGTMLDLVAGFETKFAAPMDVYNAKLETTLNSQMGMLDRFKEKVETDLQQEVSIPLFKMLEEKAKDGTLEKLEGELLALLRGVMMLAEVAVQYGPEIIQALEFAALYAGAHSVSTKIMELGGVLKGFVAKQALVTASRIADTAATEASLAVSVAEQNLRVASIGTREAEVAAIALVNAKKVENVAITEASIAAERASAAATSAAAFATGALTIGLSLVAAAIATVALNAWMEAERSKKAIEDWAKAYGSVGEESKKASEDIFEHMAKHETKMQLLKQHIQNSFKDIQDELNPMLRVMDTIGEVGLDGVTQRMEIIHDKLTTILSDVRSELEREAANYRSEIKRLEEQRSTSAEKRAVLKEDISFMDATKGKSMEDKKSFVEDRLKEILAEQAKVQTLDPAQMTDAQRVELLAKQKETEKKLQLFEKRLGDINSAITQQSVDEERELARQKVPKQKFGKPVTPGQGFEQPYPEQATVTPLKTKEQRLQDFEAAQGFNKVADMKSTVARLDEQAAIMDASSKVIEAAAKLQLETTNASARSVRDFEKAVNDFASAVKPAVKAAEKGDLAQLAALLSRGRVLSDESKTLDALQGKDKQAVQEKLGVGVSELNTAGMMYNASQDFTKSLSEIQKSHGETMEALNKKAVELQDAQSKLSIALKESTTLLEGLVPVLPDMAQPGWFSGKSGPRVLEQDLKDMGMLGMRLSRDAIIRAGTNKEPVTFRDAPGAPAQFEIDPTKLDSVLKDILDLRKVAIRDAQKDPTTENLAEVKKFTEQAVKLVQFVTSKMSPDQLKAKDMQTALGRVNALTDASQVETLGRGAVAAKAAEQAELEQRKQIGDEQVKKADVLNDQLAKATQKILQDHIKDFAPAVRDDLLRILRSNGNQVPLTEIDAWLKANLEAGNMRGFQGGTGPEELGKMRQDFGEKIKSINKTGGSGPQSSTMDVRIHLDGTVNSGPEIQAVARQIALQVSKQVAMQQNINREIGVMTA